MEEAKVYAFSAAPLKKSSIEYFASLDMPLLNIYGMSEATGAMTLHNIFDFSLYDCGFAVPGTEIMIDNADSDGKGEVCCKGRHIMMGYIKNEAATLEAID